MVLPPGRGVNVGPNHEEIRTQSRRKESSVDTVAYALLLLGALAGGFVSGLAGFGTALMALGIWLYILPPSLAVPLVLICSVIAQTATLPSMWRSFDLTPGVAVL